MHKTKHKSLAKKAGSHKDIKLNPRENADSEWLKKKNATWTKVYVAFLMQTKPPAMPVDNKKGFSSSLVGIYKKTPMC